MPGHWLRRRVPMRRSRKIVKIKPSTHADGRGYDPTPQVFPTLDHEVRTRFIVSSRSSFAWGEFRRVARRYVDNGGKHAHCKETPVARDTKIRGESATKHSLRNQLRMSPNLSRSESACFTKHDRNPSILKTKFGPNLSCPNWLRDKPTQRSEEE